MDNSEMSNVPGEAFCFAPAHGTENHDEWEDEQMKDLRQHYTSRDQVDYEFGDSHIPLSFSQIKTVEEGYQWMKSRYRTADRHQRNTDCSSTRSVCCVREVHRPRTSTDVWLGVAPAWAA